MLVVSKEKMEYRFTREVNGQNGKYYLSTFEDMTDANSVTFYHKQPLALKKGDAALLSFEMTAFNGKPQFTLEGVVDGKSDGNSK